MPAMNAMYQFGETPSEQCSSVLHKHAKALLEAAEDGMAKKRGKLRNAAAVDDDNDDDDYLEL